MRFFNNGSPADSFSPVTAAGTVAHAEVAAPFELSGYLRLGGALYLSMGLGVQYDSAEPKRGSGGYGTAGAAKAAGGLDGLNRPDCFGHQVVIADNEDTDLTTVYEAYAAFAGVFTGLVLGGGYGKNMPKNTVTASDDAAPTNGFTYVGATSTPCLDPRNGGRSYARPGDIIAVRRFGPAVAWGTNLNTAIAGSAIGFHGAADTPKDGTFVKTNVGTIVGITYTAPNAFDTTGSGQGNRILLTH